jgi:hypothetical protein
MKEELRAETRRRFRLPPDSNITTLIPAPLFCLAAHSAQQRRDFPDRSGVIVSLFIAMPDS